MVLTVDASRERETWPACGPSAMHTLIHKGQPNACIGQTQLDTMERDSEVWSLPLSRVSGQCDKNTVCRNPELSHCKGI